MPRDDNSRSCGPGDSRQLRDLSRAASRRFEARDLSERHDPPILAATIDEAGSRVE
jgi:hypothetical protein